MRTPRKLPDFIIIGTAKAGTTALFRAMSRHPQIYCSPVKEPHFFGYAGTTPYFPCPGGEASAARIISKEEDYLKLFDDCPADKVAGEASITYLSSETAPEVAARYVPNARLVAVLRHPVARAFSQWLHFRQMGIESIADFETAWNAEDERMAKGYWPSWFYRHRSLYGRHLEQWLKSFSREQLLILFYDDWLAQPTETLQAVFRHVGVAPLDNPVIMRENVTSRQPRWRWLHQRMIERNALRRWAQQRLPLSVRDAITNTIRRFNLGRSPTLDPALRAKLAVAFHDDLKTVERLTGRDLTMWRS